MWHIMHALGWHSECSLLQASGWDVGCDEHLLNTAPESTNDIRTLVNVQLATQQRNGMAVLRHLFT